MKSFTSSISSLFSNDDLSWQFILPGVTIESLVLVWKEFLLPILLAMLMQLNCQVTLQRSYGKQNGAVKFLIHDFLTSPANGIATKQDKQIKAALFQFIEDTHLQL